jgi:phosphinothricin acetyltransferase
MTIHFRPVRKSDLQTIQSIYNHYIAETTVSFRKDPVTLEQIQEIHPVDHPIYRTFVAEAKDEIIGYCSFSPYKEGKSAYDRTAEVSVYLVRENTKKGLGKRALAWIEEEARKRGIKVLLANITAENTTSVNFFRNNGYDRAGLLKNVGEKFGRVLDVVIYLKEL